jgi:3-methyl-2-oxobutanoate hydroxymethyltransferase
MNNKLNSIHDFKIYKEQEIPISVITCYDYMMGRLIANSDVDTILVGDSLGMVFSGYESTVPVSLDEMIYHAKAVKRGAANKFIIADLPYLSYHVSVEDAVKNAGRMMKETGINAVKLEGGEDFVPVVKALTTASIPVMCHLGLTPQSVHALGGYKVQGKDVDAAEKMINDALLLEAAGAFALVLEMIPEGLAKRISGKLSIPTIGIGAGRYCDGQVLVVNDMLGMNEKFTPKFLKKYADLSAEIKNALNQYNSDVKGKSFPGEENAFN